MLAAWTEVLHNVGNGVDIGELTDAIIDNNIMAALNLVRLTPEQFAPLESAIRDAYREGFLATQTNIPRRRVSGKLVPIVLDPDGGRAKTWMATHSAELVAGISADTRLTVRNYLTDAVGKGLSPNKIALDLVGRVDKAGKRVGGMIGLTESQLSHVQSYREALQSGSFSAALDRRLRDQRFDSVLRDAISNGNPLDARTIDKLTQSYTNNYLKYRGQNIAANETRIAMSAARFETLKQSVELGYVRSTEIRRFWIHSHDDRVRDEHLAIADMNSDGVGLDQPFDTPDGPVMDAPDGPGCRCYTDVRISLDT